MRWMRSNSFVIGFAFLRVSKAAPSKQQLLYERHKFQIDVRPKVALKSATNTLGGVGMAMRGRRLSS